MPVTVDRDATAMTRIVGDATATANVSKAPTASIRRRDPARERVAGATAGRNATMRDAIGRDVTTGRNGASGPIVPEGSKICCRGAMTRDVIDRDATTGPDEVSGPIVLAGSKTCCRDAIGRDVGNGRTARGSPSVRDEVIAATRRDGPSVRERVPIVLTFRETSNNICLAAGRGEAAAMTVQGGPIVRGDPIVRGERRWTRKAVPVSAVRELAQSVPIVGRMAAPAEFRDVTHYRALGHSGPIARIAEPVRNVLIFACLGRTVVGPAPHARNRGPTPACRECVPMPATAAAGLACRVSGARLNRSVARLCVPIGRRRVLNQGPAFRFLASAGGRGPIAARRAPAVNVRS